MVRISAHRIPAKKNRIGAAVIHYFLMACYYLSRSIFPLQRETTRKPPLDEVKKILVIRLDFLGDVTMSTPGFKAIRRIFPDAYITLLAAGLSRNLVEVMPFFNEIRYFDAPWMVKKRGEKVRRLYTAIRDLRRAKYDMAIDLRGDFRNNILMFLSNTRYRLGFNIAGCDFLLTHVIPCSTNHHNVNLCLDLIKYLNPKDSEEYTLFLQITDQDRARAAAIIKQLNTGNRNNSGPIVIIHPGASWHGRRWKNERFALVADRLIAEHNARLILAGSHSDREIAEKIADNMKNSVMITTGETTVREFIGLLEQSDVFLGLDSGPMHMASATGTKIVALFGPAHFNAVSPWGNGHIILSHQENFPCSPCDQTVCREPGNSCMDAIQVEEVFDAVSKQIEKNLQAE